MSNELDLEISLRNVDPVASAQGKFYLRRHMACSFMLPLTTLTDSSSFEITSPLSRMVSAEAQLESTIEKIVV